jgi:hypothetical protein
MRRITPVLALSTILAGIVFAATQHPADAACSDGSPGCESARSLVRVAELDRRREDFRGREHELPIDLWDKIRSLPIPHDKMEDLTARLVEIMHHYGDAEAGVEDAERKIREADEAIDKAKSDRIAAEELKRAAEEQRGHEYSRFVGVLEDATREFRPLQPLREPVRWHPPHRIFWHHFRGNCEVDPCAPCGCWPERRPEFFPLLFPQPINPFVQRREYREHEYREHEYREQER